MKVRLDNVRLAFPKLFVAESFNGQGDPKFSATLLFAPGSPAEAKVKQAMTEAAKGKWGDKAADMFKQLKAAGKICLQDGNAKSNLAGYEGMMYVNASNEIKPKVIDGAKRPLSIEDGKPYSGCYVNAVIEVWAQQNSYGKRINASLLGIQFAGEGERLSGGGAASEDDFEAVPGAEVADDTLSASEMFGEDDDIPF